MDANGSCTSVHGDPEQAFFDAGVLVPGNRAADNPLEQSWRIPVAWHQIELGSLRLDGSECVGKRRSLPKYGFCPKVHCDGLTRSPVLTVSGAIFYGPIVVGKSVYPHNDRATLRIEAATRVRSVRDGVFDNVTTAALSNGLNGFSLSGKLTRETRFALCGPRLLSVRPRSHHE